jgi:hypothetical protein
MLTAIPPMAWGRRWTATVREEKPSTFCMYRESQKALVVKDMKPRRTMMLICFKSAAISDEFGIGAYE